MKKKDLKTALDKIQPREELIQSTIARINNERSKPETARPFFSPMFNKGVRLAGAFCAIALAIGIGFALANSKAPVVNTPSARTLAELHTTAEETEGIALALFTLEDEAENGWIIISGKAESFAFKDLEEKDAEEGITHRAKVKFNTEKVIEKSDNLSVDLNKTNAVLDISVMFYGNDSADSFADATSGDILLKLTPDGNGGWILLDFLPMQSNG